MNWEDVGEPMNDAGIGPKRRLLVVSFDQDHADPHLVSTDSDQSLELRVRAPASIWTNANFR